MAEAPKVVFVAGDGVTAELCEEVTRHFSNFEVVELNLDKGTPSESLVEVINTAISHSTGKHFLITRFPHTVEDAEIFEEKTGLVPKLVLFFIQQDFTTFQAFSNHSYETKGLVTHINANVALEKISDRIKVLHSRLVQEELLELSEQLLVAIDSGDYDMYKKLCDDQLTAFEPESQGQLIEGLPFHKFYFDMRNSGGKFIQRVSTIAAPRVALLSDDAALVTYTRLMQGIGTPLAGYVDAYNETRVWKRKTISGKTQWKNVHFHRSQAPTVPEFYKVTT